MTRLRIIAFTGPKTCGKDTCCTLLQGLNQERQLNLFQYRQMAGGAKAIASLAFGYPLSWNDDQELKEKPLETWPFICPRQLVIDVANWYRDTYGGEVWANKWERDALAEREGIAQRGWMAQLIPDLRFPEEVEMLGRHQSLIIYVDRKQSEETLQYKRRAGDVMANNVSESHYAMLRARANAVVDNNGTLAHLYGQLMAIIGNSWGHFKFWDGLEDAHAGFAKDRIGQRIA